MYRYSNLCDKTIYQLVNLVKFKKLCRSNYVKCLKSLLVRGVKVLWEIFPSEVQKATTKVKFKVYMKEICRYKDNRPAYDENSYKFLCSSISLCYYPRIMS